MAFQEPSLYADSIDPVHRVKLDEVFLIRVEAAPEPDTADFETEGGGFFNCYIDADDLRTAELRAISLIGENGWKPVRFDAWELICEDCANDERSEEDAKTARELVEQALSDGASCVIYTWPIDAQDAPGR